ncbi:MAG: hypothetical protein JW940_33805 [Polyangiaceae bacterium]|nr:hypothetical protein [Polyangiaceae bacterium]
MRNLRTWIAAACAAAILAVLVWEVRSTRQGFESVRQELARRERGTEQGQAPVANHTTHYHSSTVRVDENGIATEVARRLERREREVANDEEPSEQQQQEAELRKQAADAEVEELVSPLLGRPVTVDEWNELGRTIWQAGPDTYRQALIERVLAKVNSQELRPPPGNFINPLEGIPMGEGAPGETPVD